MTASPSQDLAAAEEIRLRARQTNYDWYLAALLSPRAVRADLIALAAFAGDVQRIPATVTEPMMGAIRLQWWRDALEQPPDVAIGHPVADAVRSVVVRHRLTKAYLQAQIDATERSLHPEPFEDRQALSIHFGKTYGSRFRLAAECLRGSDDLAPRDRIQCAAEAYGYASLAAFTTAARAANAEVPTWLEVGPPGAGISILPEILAADAVAALVRLRAIWSAVPRPQRPAFLPVALVEPYLRVSEVPGRGTEPSEFARAWRMLVTKWRGRV